MLLTRKYCASENCNFSKKTRGLSFEEVAIQIEAKKIIAVEKNPRRNNQNIYIIEIDDYAVVVPFIETENEIFLKTIFKSRKFSKKYGLRN